MHWKTLIAIILLVLAAIFTVQNATVVSIQFLFWKLEVSRVLMVIFLLGIGFALGWITASLKTRPQRPLYRE